MTLCATSIPKDTCTVCECERPFQKKTDRPPPARRPPAACPPAAAAAGSHESFVPNIYSRLTGGHSIGTALPEPPHSTERQNVTPAIMPAVHAPPTKVPKRQGLSLAALRGREVGPRSALWCDEPERPCDEPERPCDEPERRAERGSLLVGKSYEKLR